MMDKNIRNIEYFELQIGGFFCGFTRIRLEKTSSGYFLGYYPGFANPEDAKKEEITRTAYETILEKVISCNLLNWEEEYINPEIDDGTQWTIRLKIENEIEREWYGCNLYPGKEEWNSFIQTMNTLPIPSLDYEI
ncbi:MAG: hypothetical protein Q4E53_09665 [Eubacteriales bacterium]|nr:hypothetical protein [Eubacteriales bacterium]